MNVFYLAVKARHALIQLQRAVEQVADIARQYAVQHTVIDAADILKIQPIPGSGIFRLNLSGEHGALHHDPRHDRRQAQRDARHFTGIQRLQIGRDALLVVIAKEKEIFMRVIEKLHGFIEHARHEHYIGCFAVGKYLRMLIGHIANYTPVFLDFILTFCEKRIFRT